MASGLGDARGRPSGVGDEGRGGMGSVIKEASFDGQWEVARGEAALLCDERLPFRARFLGGGAEEAGSGASWFLDLACFSDSSFCLICEWVRGTLEMRDSALLTIMGRAAVRSKAWWVDSWLDVGGETETKVSDVCADVGNGMTLIS